MKTPDEIAQVTPEHVQEAHAYVAFIKQRKGTPTEKLTGVLAAAIAMTEALAGELAIARLKAVERDGFEEEMHRWRERASRIERETVERCAALLMPTNDLSDWTEYAKDCARHAAALRSLLTPTVEPQP